MDRVLAILAMLVLFGFLGILAFSVPSPDLLIVIAVTLLLAAYDFFRPGNGGRK